jgi:O-antigen/teichoic acid export membrane protein
MELTNFLKSEGFLKYFKNTSWLLFDKILRIIIALFIGVWVGRYLGPEKFGIFSYVNSYIGIFTAIAALGLDSIIVHEIVKDLKNINKILGTSIILKLAGFLIVFCLILISVNFTVNDDETNKLIYILSFGIFFQSFSVIQQFFNSQTKSKYILYVNTFALVITSITKILLIMSNASLVYFVLATVFDLLVIALGYIYMFKVSQNLSSILKWRWDFKLACNMLSESWPLILSSLTFVVYNNVDTLMIKNMLDDHSVGVYGAATRLVLPWQFIPGLVITSVSPALVRSFKEGGELFYKRLKYLSSFLIWFALFLSFFYTFFSETIIKLTYGDSFIESTEIMVYLIWGNVFIFFNSIWNRWMLLKGQTKKTFYFSLTSCIFNVVLNYFMIIEFGTLGASISILLSLFLSYIIFYVIIDYKVIKLFFKGVFFKF